MWRLVGLGLVVGCLGWAAGLVCPDNRQCYCVEESAGEFRVTCSANGSASSPFEVTYQRRERLLIECAGPGADWAEFLLGSSLQLGPVRSLVFSSCGPPGQLHSARVARLLGLRELHLLKFVLLNGTLARHDLRPYAQLSNLVLSNNDLSNVTADLIADLTGLRLLELRNTNIRLEPGFFDSASQLRVLELGSNQLGHVEPGTFRHLASLELLNLWKNDFKQLQPGLFDNLTALLSLDLNQNALNTLPPQIFKDLVKLKVVNLSSNNFTSLPEGLFRNNSGLRVVKLLHNQQNLTELPGGLFANLTSLESVMMTRNGLLRLPEDLFWGATGLRNLTIDRNYLRSLPPRLFRDTAELYVLSLSFNDLNHLPDRVFENATKLTRLDLSRNHLTSINEKMLVGLESLRMLNMEDNDLSFIHIDAFGSLGNLKVAKFANNQLSLHTGLYDIFGHISPFHHCHSLEELYLAHNNVTEMHSDWVVSNTRLHELDLKYNSFNYLQTEDLQFISSRVNVDLRHNNISRIVLSRLEQISVNQTEPRNVMVDMADNPIRCDCEVYELLRYLNGDMHPYVHNYVHLKPGNLSCDTPDYMRGYQVTELRAKTLKCLVESEQHRPGDPCSPLGDACACWLRPEDRALLLDCAGRNLSRAPEWIDARAVARVELDLSGNRLREPPSLYKKGYDKLTSLNLADNDIAFIDERLLSPSLKTLILDGNNLTSIDSKILTRLSNSSRITKLSLAGNPFSCSCSARQLLSFVQSNLLAMPELLEVRCGGDGGRRLSGLSVDELCRGWWSGLLWGPAGERLLLLGALGVLGSVGLGLLGLVAACLCHRQRLCVWLFSTSWCRWLVSEDELDKLEAGSKRYDAFVSYSHKDEELVVKQLVAGLEGDKAPASGPYKLCIHERDWLAGEWIPRQIERSVEQSSRTIIVLSDNFLESVWSRLEFQAAHKQALADRRARLIVILLGEVDPLKLEPELRSYLAANTYLKWGDPWFWQKLRYALPRRPKLARGPGPAPKDDDGCKKPAAEPAAPAPKSNGIMHAVKEINKNMREDGFEIRAPQCTTV